MTEEAVRFGRYVKKRREELLLSAIELADKANLAPLTVYRIEGFVPCKPPTRRKILAALGKSLRQYREETKQQNNQGGAYAAPRRVEKSE